MKELKFPHYFNVYQGDTGPFIESPALNHEDALEDIISIISFDFTYGYTLKVTADGAEKVYLENKARAWQEEQEDSIRAYNAAATLSTQQLI